VLYWFVAFPVAGEALTSPLGILRPRVDIIALCTYPGDYRAVAAMA